MSFTEELLTESPHYPVDDSIELPIQLRDEDIIAFSPEPLSEDKKGLSDDLRRAFTRELVASEGLNQLDNRLRLVVTTLMGAIYVANLICRFAEEHPKEPKHSAQFAYNNFYSLRNDLTYQKPEDDLGFSDQSESVFWISMRVFGNAETVQRMKSTAVKALDNTESKLRASFSEPVDCERPIEVARVGITTEYTAQSPYYQDASKIKSNTLLVPDSIKKEFIQLRENLVRYRFAREHRDTYFQNTIIDKNLGNLERILTKGIMNVFDESRARVPEDTHINGFLDRLEQTVTDYTKAERAHARAFNEWLDGIFGTAEHQLPDDFLAILDA